MWDYRIFINETALRSNGRDGDNIEHILSITSPIFKIGCSMLKKAWVGSSVSVTVVVSSKIHLLVNTLVLRSQLAY